SALVALASEVFRRIRAAGGGDARRRGRDGLGVLRCAQKRAGSQRRHRAWKRGPNRAVRGTRARALCYVIGPAPKDLQCWRGGVAMMLIAAVTASLVTNAGGSAWFIGALSSRSTSYSA